MPGKKADLSKLVMLSLTPTEAVIVAGALTIVRDRAQEIPPMTRQVLDGTCARIDLQLRHLKWPEQLRKAPFPV